MCKARTVGRELVELIERLEKYGTKHKGIGIFADPSGFTVRRYHGGLYAKEYDEGKANTFDSAWYNARKASDNRIHEEEFRANRIIALREDIAWRQAELEKLIKRGGEST